MSANVRGGLDVTSLVQNMCLPDEEQLRPLLGKRG